MNFAYFIFDEGMEKREEKERGKEEGREGERGQAKGEENALSK